MNSVVQKLTGLRARLANGAWKAPLFAMKRAAGAAPVTARSKPYRRPDDDVAAMLRAFKASSVLRPPD